MRVTLSIACLCKGYDVKKPPCDVNFICLTALGDSDQPMSDVERLLKALQEVVKGTMAKGEIGILFSGGLDSGLLAAIAGQHGTPYLYTVGIDGSHDLRAGRETAKELKLPWTGMVLTSDEVISATRDLLSVCPIRDPVVLSFQLPLYIIAARSREDVLMSGQGADELFGGYNRYLNMTPAVLERSMNDDLGKLLAEVQPLDQRIAAHFSKSIDHPFLDPEVRRAASKIEATDKVRDGVRKIPLRETAVRLGYPSLANREKKAAQYGSGFMKVLKSRSRRAGMNLSEYVSGLAPEPSIDE